MCICFFSFVLLFFFGNVYNINYVGIFQSILFNCYNWYKWRINLSWLISYRHLLPVCFLQIYLKINVLGFISDRVCFCNKQDYFYTDCECFKLLFTFIWFFFCKLSTGLLKEINVQVYLIVMERFLAIN